MVLEKSFMLYLGTCCTWGTWYIHWWSFTV